MTNRVDLSILQNWIDPGSRVLDLACGNGELLQQLRDNKQVEGYGLEIDPQQITACIAKDVNVIETDINAGLRHFADHAFDTVVMTQALQVMHNPHKVLEEMLRIGKQCIVTFPNFGNWRARWHLMFHGRMPKTRQLAYEWYDTPNIHFCTVKDFERLCSDMHLLINHREFVAERNPDRTIKGLWPNMFSETAIYHLTIQEK